MAIKRIPLGPTLDPRLRQLTEIHDTVFAVNFGDWYEQQGGEERGIIGRPAGGATIYPDGLTGLNPSAQQSVDFASNFGIGLGAFVAIFGVTVPTDAAVQKNGTWLKLGDQSGTGAGYEFGLSGSASTGFESPGNYITALYENRAWLNSGVELSGGFHVVAFFHNGDKTTYFYVDSASSFGNVLAGSVPIAPAQIARFGGQMAYGGMMNRHTACKIHWALLANRRSGAANMEDLIAAAVRLYPAGEYIPHTALRSTFYSLPSGSITLNSLSMSAFTPSGARATLSITR